MLQPKLTRRHFLRTLALAAGGAFLSGYLPPAAAGALPVFNLQSTDFVTVRGDQFYLRGNRLPIRGFNYYPRLHPWKTYNLGEWDRAAVDYELRLGASLGANVVRTFIDFNYSLDNSKAQQPLDNYFAPVTRYLDNVREFLDLAAKYNLLVIFALLDSMDWSLYAPQNVWIVEEYARALIPAFANDPRILCWDLQNEPDKAIRMLGAEVVIPFFKRLSTLTRALAPNHLQTIGWIDRARAQYFPELNDLLDFWCFHFYDNAANLPALIQFYRGQTKKPVMLQEFGLATGGPGPDGAHTEADQAAHYTQVLTQLDNAQMCGSVLWTLMDFPQGLAGNPPSPLDSPENHFGIFRVDYTEKPAANVIRALWNGKK